jgi:hypothetical protein
MNEKLVDDFVKYVENSKIKSFRVCPNINNIEIVRSVFTYRSYVDIFLIACMIYVTVTIDDPDFYLIPLIAAWIFILGMAWSDFRSINNLVIDIQNRNIQILNRNPLQRLILNLILKKKDLLDFNDIFRFKVDSTYRSRVNMEIYSVHLALKNGDSFVIIKLSEEEQVKRFAGFLNSIIKIK